MKKIVLLIVFIFMSNIGWAQVATIDEEHRQLALKLLMALKVDKQIDQQFDNMKELQQNMMNEYGLSEAFHEDTYSAEIEKTWNYLANTLSWENVKEDFIDVYAQVFTKRELKELTEFFNSPIGQSFVDKVPDLSIKLMRASIDQFNIEEKINTARHSANQALAQSTLRTLSTAAETFAVVNKGVYPSDISQLVDASPPYLYEGYCNTETSGYYYTCEMTENSYKFTAASIEVGAADKKIFTITTGGIMDNM